MKKGFSSKYQSPEEGQSAQEPKYCEYKNKYEHNSSNQKEVYSIKMRHLFFTLTLSNSNVFYLLQNVRLLYKSILLEFLYFSWYKTTFCTLPNNFFSENNLVQIIINANLKVQHLFNMLKECQFCQAVKVFACTRKNMQSRIMLMEY